MAYVFFPLISWQLYFVPVFASQKFIAPIPKTTIANSTINSIFSQASGAFSTVDYTNAQNWFPQYPAGNNRLNPKVESYTLSIPKLNLKDLKVSTVDTILSIHLVNYGGTAVPPDKGNAVIFGHSTLPQLFNPKDYKTVFANAYQLKAGDEIFAGVGGVSYLYKISDISIVEPNDTSIFTQDYSDSFLTLVTCTPPGTVWKRLVIRARMQKI